MIKLILFVNPSWRGESVWCDPLECFPFWQRKIISSSFNFLWPRRDRCILTGRYWCQCRAPPVAGLVSLDVMGGPKYLAAPRAPVDLELHRRLLRPRLLILQRRRLLLVCGLVGLKRLLRRRQQIFMFGSSSATRAASRKHYEGNGGVDLILGEAAVNVRILVGGYGKGEDSDRGSGSGRGGGGGPGETAFRSLSLRVPGHLVQRRRQRWRRRRLVPADHGICSIYVHQISG